MAIYYSPGTIAVAVLITLEETGMAYTPVKLDFQAAEQTSSDYLKLNPKGRVPAMVLEDGTVLTETGAMLEFVATLHPEAGLIPASPEDAAHMRSVMYYLASTVHVAHAHKMRGNRWANQQSSFDDMKAKVPKTMTACATYIEYECLRGDYALGDAFSLADAYMFVVCNWLSGDGVTVSDFPKITAFMERMEERESVKTARSKGFL